MTPNLLTLEDIADQRAYERDREEFRRDVIAAKKLRRVTVGPVVTVLFESRQTVRFQVQEMARAEKLTTDAQIQAELDVYNRLLPGSGELSATLFLELTTEDELRTWLPRLLGIERSLVLEIGEGSGHHVVRSEPEAAHASQLTRPEATSAVHYVRFRCNAAGSTEMIASRKWGVALHLVETQAPASRVNEVTLFDPALAP